MSKLIVKRNDYKGTLKCDWGTTEVKVTHKLGFFPAQYLDIIILNEEIPSDHKIELKEFPIIRTEYNFKLFQSIILGPIDVIKKSLNYKCPEIGHLAGMLTCMTYKLEREFFDKKSFIELVSISERGDLEDLHDYILRWLVEYTTLYNKFNLDEAKIHIEWYIKLLSETFVKKWSNHRLHLLGFNNADIMRLSYSQSDMYSSLVDNKISAFTLCNLTHQKKEKTCYKKCEDIMRRSGRSNEITKTSIIMFHIHKDIINKCENSGDCYLLYNYFEKNVERYMDILREQSGVSDLSIEEVIMKLKHEYNVRIELDDSEDISKARVYPDWLYMIEEHSYLFFVDRITKNRSSPSGIVKSAYNNFMKNNSDDISHLSIEQKEGFKLALTSHVSIITGGGGSGKTRTISAIVNALSNQRITVQMTSFTGKAVARMKEMCKGRGEYILDPVTMDRMISMKKRVKFDYLIIDEGSMITDELFFRFIRKHTGNYPILFVGDNNQLQPIGIGNLFHTLYESCAIPVTKFNRNYRVRSEGSLLPNVHSLVTDNKNFTQGDDFKIFQTKSETESKDLLNKLMIKLKSLGMKHNDLRFLSFFRDPLSYLNNITLETFFGKKPSYRSFLEGQDVYANSNIYTHNIFNGDVGKVIEVTPARVLVEFENDNEYSFLVGDPPEQSEPYSNDKKENKEEDVVLYTSMLEHSYATTIHASQGSQYHTVILYLQHRKRNPGDFLSINLLYTALSRAEDVVYLIGDSDMINKCIQNSPPKPLNNLANRLRKHFGITEISESLVECTQDEDDIDDDDFDY